MLGMFGIFGRSLEMQRLDDAFRAAGLQPRAVPDAVKIATLKQLKEATGSPQPDQQSCASAATLLAYCLLGAQAFAAKNGDAVTQVVETRLSQAIEFGHGLDARLVLLTMHAGLTHPSVVERFGLTVE
jgi:hypothetical protein